MQPVCRHLARTYWGRGCPLETCRLDLFRSLCPPSISPSPPKRPTQPAVASFCFCSPGLVWRGATLSCPPCLLTSGPDPLLPPSPFVCVCTARRLLPRCLHYLLFLCIVTCSVLHGHSRKTCDRTTIDRVGSLTVALLPRDLHPCVQTCTLMMSIMLNMTTGPDTIPATTTAARDPPGTDPLIDSPTALRSTATVTADEPRPSREPTPPLSSPTGTTSASP